MEAGISAHYLSQNGQKFVCFEIIFSLTEMKCSDIMIN